MCYGTLGPFGHAFEMRVYAEDTAAGFVPAPGNVHTLKAPKMECRIESAIVEGICSMFHCRSSSIVSDLSVLFIVYINWHAKY